MDMKNFSAANLPAIYVYDTSQTAVISTTRDHDITQNITIKVVTDRRTDFEQTGLKESQGYFHLRDIVGEELTLATLRRDTVLYLILSDPTLGSTVLFSNDFEVIFEENQTFDETTYIDMATITFTALNQVATVS